jgi:hypothetical protein
MICALVVVWLATTFDVDVQGPAWQAEALRATLTVDLASDQLTVAPRGELHVAVTMAEGELRYVLSRDGVAPVRGRVVLPIDRPALAGILKDALHDIVPHDDAVTLDDLVVPPPRPGLGAFAALALLAGLVIAPLVIARRRMRASGRLVFALAGIVLAGVTLTTSAIDEASGGLFVVGGLAWGAALAVCIPIALPQIAGLHRVEHRELGIVLRAWFVLALQRTLWVAALLAALFGVLWLVGGALDVPVLVTFGVIAPLVVLIVRLVWRAVVEILAARLDKQLVEPEGADAWDVQVHGYLAGYLRRANLDVDEDLLARIKFLSGDGERVAIYGGGLTHTRVVIGRVMLERALAPYGRPHDYAMPRVSTLHWTHWNAGLVMPTASDEVLASRDDRDPTRSAHASAEVAEHERIALGELPTLTGIIEPIAFDARTSYRPDEDPLWLDWDPGEEHDGTDAGDKDFLFGLLVGALGMAQRHEDRAATLALAFPKAAQRLARVTGLFRTNALAVADVSAVLGGARHHLAQYLAWQLWQREDLMTARAYVPQLEQASRAILAALQRDPEDTMLHARLRALRRFIDPRAVVKRSQRQRLAIAFAVLAACAAVATLAVQAVLYHSTYEERHHRDGKRSE